MSFRTVIIKSCAKLELNLNYLVYRTIEETKRILISEIHTLILQSTAISITSALLCELSSNKVKVIFCDTKCNPHSELIPYYGNCQSVQSIFYQNSWTKSSKEIIWKRIVEEKIVNQSSILLKHGLAEKAQQVYQFSKYVENDDLTNREGHSAKVYFNSLFGSGFVRGKDDNINAALNYGYTILLSQFNREIVSLGYLTQIGIHHKNVNNQFNLSCDLIEPFRPIVDDKVKTMSSFENFKKEIIDMLTINVIIDGKTQILPNAIKIYSNSVINAIQENDPNKIVFFTNYEL